nr:DUF4373 domain-containing protein [Frisingicoccus sp.]
MAGRQNKVGLDYFELDCQMEEKVRLIQAEYGLKGFAVFVKLLQKIYGEHGYYCEWTQDSELLFMSENGLDSGFLQLLREIVSACIRRNIFSERLYKEYGILTSSGVQKQYLKATVKREVVDLKKEYLLISVPQNRVNVVINSISSTGNSINDGINTQSRVEKSILNHCAPEPHDSNFDKEEQLKKDFEIIYGIYPKKKGKTVAFANYKLWVGNGKDVGGKRYKLTNRQIYLAVKRYIKQQEESGQDDLQYWKNFDTLMGRQLLDYVEVEDGKNS